MRIRSLALLAILVALPAVADDVSIVQPFLPKNAHVCSIRTADARSGRVIERHPAILRGSLAGDGSTNIVAAYSSEPQDNCMSVNLLVLGRDHNEWMKIAAFSFPGEYLWAENFKTTGLQILKLPGSSKDGIVLITAMGAALGARIQVLEWDESAKNFANIAPRDAGGDDFELQGDSFIVHTKNKLWKYVFDGKRFIRARQ